MQKLEPKGRKNLDKLINYIYENIVRFTDEDSQRKIFTIIRMYNPDFGGTALLKTGEPVDIKEVVVLSKLTPKTLDALKEFIDTNTYPM